MLRYKPSKHTPLRTYVPKWLDIRTTMVYNWQCKSKKSKLVNQPTNLTNVRSHEEQDHA